MGEWKLNLLAGHKWGGRWIVVTRPRAGLARESRRPTRGFRGGRRVRPWGFDVGHAGMQESVDRGAERRFGSGSSRENDPPGRSMVETGSTRGAVGGVVARSGSGGKAWRRAST